MPQDKEETQKKRGDEEQDGNDRPPNWPSEGNERPPNWPSKEFGHKCGKGRDNNPPKNPKC